MVNMPLSSVETRQQAHACSSTPEGDRSRGSLLSVQVSSLLKRQTCIRNVVSSILRSDTG
jgi:hypothetical protein